ncbi:uncharacterized protein BDW43DRAFT_174480 [Aspergillus alliaceus]|uniref:uncharacterized protein n=1 Tax=Petromyces alliaceus TaxID=209559 RepID=UPI0012A50F16|nr:uncharacterized protein BDW43DRAFT_174480 [Aspergillus alliaceus]KAB8229995.1 hypothetical protein BDW43DRAFT_174480 [Aspergillus alliaceus]
MELPHVIGESRLVLVLLVTNIIRDDFGGSGRQGYQEFFVGPSGPWVKARWSTSFLTPVLYLQVVPHAVTIFSFFLLLPIIAMLISPPGCGQYTHVHGQSLYMASYMAS